MPSIARLVHGTKCSAADAFLEHEHDRRPQAMMSTQAVAVAIAGHILFAVQDPPKERGCSAGDQKRRVRECLYLLGSVSCLRQDPSTLLMTALADQQDEETSPKSVLRCPCQLSAHSTLR